MKVSLHDECVCSGDIVTYECTIDSDYGGITLWMGDFFDCLGDSQVIELIHSHFITNKPGGQASNAHICNDGNVTGRIISNDNGSFISQLDVILTSDIAGKAIECALDNGTVHKVGSLNLSTG